MPRIILLTCQNLCLAALTGTTAGHELALYAIYLEGNAIAHVVDTLTAFWNAVTFLGKPPLNISNALVACWTTLYDGHPSLIRIGEKAEFCIFFTKGLS